MKNIAWILFLLSGNLTAQITMEGKILDTSGKPVPFATVGLSRQATGTISNGSGYFILKLPVKFKNDSVSISHVGFEQRVVPVNSFTGTPQNIYLKEAVLELAEVVVTSISAREMISRAIDGLKHNYDHSPTLYTVYTAQEDFIDKNPALLLEAVVKVKTRNRNAQFEIAKLRGRPSGKEYNPYFKIARSTWIMDIEYARLEKQGIGWGLKKSEMRFYNYFFDSTLVYNKREVQIIRAELNSKGRKKKNDTFLKYYDTIKYYVDKEDYAVIRCEQSGGEWDRSVEYQFIDGFWYLKKFHRDVRKIDPRGPDSLWKDVGSFKTTAVVTKIESEGFNEIQPLGYKIVQEIKHRIDDWNDEFWQEYNFVKLDSIWLK